MRKSHVQTKLLTKRHVSSFPQTELTLSSLGFFEHSQLITFLLLM